MSRHRPPTPPGSGPGDPQGLGPGHPLLALTATQTGQVGDPVPGRPVGQLLLGEVSGVGLGQGPGLDRRRGRDSCWTWPTVSISSSSERADHSVSAEVADQRHASASTSAGAVPGASSGIDIPRANQGPPTIRPISTGFIPRIRDNPQKRNSGPFTVHRNLNRNHKEQPKPGVTRKATTSGTSTTTDRHHTLRSFVTHRHQQDRRTDERERPPRSRQARPTGGLDQRRGLDRLDQRAGSTNEGVSTGSTNGRGLDRLDQREGSTNGRLDQREGPTGEISSQRPSRRPSATGCRPRGSRRCHRRRRPAGCRPRSRCGGP